MITRRLSPLISTVRALAHLRAMRGRPRTIAQTTPPSLRVEQVASSLGAVSGALVAAQVENELEMMARRRVVSEPRAIRRAAMPPQAVGHGMRIAFAQRNFRAGLEQATYQVQPLRLLQFQTKREA